MTALLIVFGGPPGTGKTTLARMLSARRRAAYLRIDVIEQALRRAMAGEIGAAGYDVGNALAASNRGVERRVRRRGVAMGRGIRRAWFRAAWSLPVRRAGAREPIQIVPVAVAGALWT